MSLKRAITQKVHHPGFNSIAVFFAMLLVSAGSWGVEHSGHDHVTWTELLQPEHLFSFLGVIGGVLGAWLSKSPLKE